MAHVLCLIVKPDSRALTRMVLHSAQKAVLLSGGNLEQIRWLAEEEACEIYIKITDITLLKQILGKTLPKNIDYAVLPVLGRRKRALVADMDSTIIGQECIDEVARVTGQLDKIVQITDSTMEGALDFAESLRKRAKLLAGVKEETLFLVHEKYITLNSGAKTLVETMTHFGAKTVLVTGGFSFFAERVCKSAGFGTVLANKLEILEGRVTGKIAEPILDTKAKRYAIENLTSQFGIEPFETVAVGDGANDIDMISIAGIGAAYHGRAALLKVADIQINNGDLTALLYVQGYKKSQFILS